MKTALIIVSANHQELPGKNPGLRNRNHGRLVVGRVSYATKIVAETMIEATKTYLRPQIAYEKRVNFDFKTMGLIILDKKRPIPYH
ncbi:MAG: hypothetical protein GXP30_15420 [Verrucomicrobia bacterium]|nr:hypothetical protein [Verrucomicrobiota bacterium]